ncbi:MAG: 1-acyl-sn-glycerol-3-phosphate acyltransferase [Treponema sp.]|nr:1-acyl-sn-glycerol-3-phosphate acyltransferase [Treponema sp.]
MFKTIIVFSYVAFALVFLMPFGLVALVFYFLGLRKSMANVIYRIAQGWAFSIVKLTGAKVNVTGKENIPKQGSVCFVSNHCGYFDIALLLAYCGRQFGFVAKKELLYVPFLNAWIYMLGGLFIDRKNVRKAIKTINKGVERIKAGGGMIIFPEGSRSRGRGLLPFHPGSLKLATTSLSPIVPVAIEGSYDIFEKNKRVVRGVNVKITFLPVIETVNLPPEEKKTVLCDRIYSAIGEQLTKSKEQ